jgi:PKD repeat protein
MFKQRKEYLFTLIAILTILLALNKMMAPTLAAQPPVAIFSFAPQQPLVNQTVSFDASTSYDPDGTILSYQWSFGDGTPNVTTADKTATHAYSTVGNYTVALTVTDNAGLKGSAAAVVPVHWYPKASFVFSPTTPFVNQTVTFNASSSMANGGTIVSYSWDFGDGNTAIVTTPITTHVYSAFGNCTITLTIVDSYGLSDNSTSSITVVKPPIADFTFSPSYPRVGEPVTFDASTSKPDGGAIVNYSWNFGDNQNATGKIVTHAYAAYGSFIVTLNITDSENLSNSTSKQVNVRQYPTALFTYAPSPAHINETVTFNASSSMANGGIIVSCSWDFGDGQTGTGVITSHAYAPYGTYSINLTVTNSGGLGNTTTHSIRVIIPPVANFTIQPTHLVMNRQMLFNASQSYDPDGSIVAYAWNFGDGNITNVNTPLIYHTYTGTGVYQILLNVTDNDGLGANTAMTVGVYSPWHDVAVDDIVPERAWAYQGYNIKVNVTIENKGDFPESVTVTLYYNITANQKVGTQSVNLLPGQIQTLIFTWTTTGVQYGQNYTTTAVAAISLDNDLTNNLLSNGQIEMRIPGDVNDDGKVNLIDYFGTALAYGSSPTVLEQKWNPMSDINGDGKIDLIDVFIVALNYGKASAP